MTLANVSSEELIRSLADIGNRFLLPDPERDAECIADENFVEIASKGLDHLSEPSRSHLLRCPDCAHEYSMLRSAYLNQHLPRRWNTALACDAAHGMTEGQRVQIIGRISLESFEFEPSSDDSDWMPHPLFMRVDVVVDLDLGLFSVAILDVPDEISAGSIQGPSGWIPLSRNPNETTLELDEFYAPDRADNLAFRTSAAFLNSVASGRLRISFQTTPPPGEGVGTREDTESLLFRLGVVERDFCYRLPNNLRCDTHANVGKLCRHEFAIQQVAAAIDELFAAEKFDCVLAHGWTMGTVARRLCARRADRKKQPRDAMSVGYGPPILVSDIPPASRVLILTDVVMTGGLVQDLMRLVADAKGKVVGVGAVVAAEGKGLFPPREVRALSQIEMRIVPEEEECPEPFVTLEDRVFNPFSSSMTRKKNEARSPSQFLKGNA